MSRSWFPINILQLKELGHLREMTVFRAESGKIQDKPGASCNMKVKIYSKNKMMGSHETDTVTMGKHPQWPKLERCNQQIK